jgi:IclR family KDG regulon transcriptional repressor
MDKEQYKELIKKVRVDGYAVEREEYIEGIRALAVPLRIQRRDLDMAIWVVGLKSQIKIDKIPSLSKILIKTCENIEEAFSF